MTVNRQPGRFLLLLLLFLLLILLLLFLLSTIIFIKILKMKMLIVFYFKNLPGCLLTPRPATTVPRALLQRHVSPLAAPPELR